MSAEQQGHPEEAPRAPSIHARTVSSSNCVAFRNLYLNINVLVQNNSRYFMIALRSISLVKKKTIVFLDV